MIWHIVRFDFSGVDPAVREEIHAELAALADLDVVAWLQVGADLTEPHVTGLLSAFVDEDALEAYRVHPEHLPVVHRIRDLGIEVVRLDVMADDGPTAA